MHEKMNCLADSAEFVLRLGRIESFIRALSNICRIGSILHFVVLSSNGQMQAYIASVGDSTGIAIRISVPTDCFSTVSRSLLGTSTLHVPVLSSYVLSQLAGVDWRGIIRLTVSVNAEYLSVTANSSEGVTIEQRTRSVELNTSTMEAHRSAILRTSLTQGDEVMIVVFDFAFLERVVDAASRMWDNKRKRRNKSEPGGSVDGTTLRLMITPSLTGGQRLLEMSTGNSKEFFALADASSFHMNQKSWDALTSVGQVQMSLKEARLFLRAFSRVTHTIERPQVNLKISAISRENSPAGVPETLLILSTADRNNNAGDGNGPLCGDLLESCFDYLSRESLTSAHNSVPRGVPTPLTSIAFDEGRAGSQTDSDSDSKSVDGSLHDFLKSEEAASGLL